MSGQEESFSGQSNSITLLSLAGLHDTFILREFDIHKNLLITYIPSLYVYIGLK